MIFFPRDATGRSYDISLKCHAKTIFLSSIRTFQRGTKRIQVLRNFWIHLSFFSGLHRSYLKSVYLLAKRSGLLQQGWGLSSTSILSIFSAPIFKLQNPMLIKIMILIWGIQNKLPRYRPWKTSWTIQFSVWCAKVGCININSRQV